MQAQGGRQRPADGGEVVPSPRHGCAGPCRTVPGRPLRNRGYLPASGDGTPPGATRPSPVAWRERDLNPRPLGYEPNELPNCSTALLPILSLMEVAA
jgi:hypothetical protein